MREHVETSIENMYYVNEWLDDGRLQKRHVINMQVNYEKSTLKMDHSTMYVPCANCLLFQPYIMNSEKTLQYDCANYLLWY